MMYEIGPFHYSFKKDGVKEIFCDSKISIKEGELVLISGSSGSGKSTLLQILKGIIPEFKAGVFSGSVLYNGHPLHDDFFQNNLKDILFLFQNPFTQLLYQNASEEFLFSMENYSYTKEEMDRKKKELQEYFNLENLWDKKTANLSNGECQRLVLASLLAVDPKVLLLDEPTAFLDPQARTEFYEWLSKIKGSKTIILVDHHIEEILPSADKIIHVSDKGEISEVKLPHEPAEQIEKDYEWSTSVPANHEKLKLRLSHLYFEYPDQSGLLKDINLNASSGDIIVIRGKNGRGKSTLFKLMAGILKPTEGEIELYAEGTPVAFKKIQKRVGFVFQNPETHFFYDTIREELACVSKENLSEILGKFFYGIDIDRSPFLLSEGEKRRLSLLMTVFLNKSILFYDEPTFGQDRNSIQMIRSMILNQQSQGKIQFIISHDDRFIESLSPFVYELASQTLKRL
jgi:energy-coupling factor transporter ATP-binding protein EcfA2